MTTPPAPSPPASSRAGAGGTAAGAVGALSSAAASPRIGILIVWLLMAGLALAIIVFGALAWAQGRQVYGATGRYVRSTARLLEEHASRIIGIHAEEMRGIEFTINAMGWERIASTPLLHERLRAAAEQSPEVDSYWIIDRTGQVVVNSQSFPPATVNVADRDYFQAHLSADRPPYVGHRLVGKTNGHLFVPISLRLHHADGSFAGVGQVSLDPAYFREFYSTVLTQKGSQVLLLHEDGSVLVREPAGADPAPADLGRHPELLPGAGADEPVVRVSPVDGVSRLMAAHRVGNLPVFVVYGVATQTLDAEVSRRRLAYGAFAAVAAVVLSGLAAVALLRSRQLEGAHRSLRAAHAELEQRIAERTRHLDEALAEREVLIRDIHHRVKNNLQVIASLLQLQAASVPAMRPHFDEALRRVDAMGVLHELVYRNSAIGRIRLDDALAQLCRRLDDLYQGGRGPVHLVIDADPVEIDVERCGQIMLMLNEILSNAFKYAYPDGDGGPVRVELRQYDGNIDLLVADRGVGMPAASRQPGGRPGSVGLKLVEAFALHLGARYSFSSEGGTVFRMVVPLDPEEGRVSKTAPTGVPAAAAAFDGGAARYDALRRTLVPGFDAFYGNVAEVIADWRPGGRAQACAPSTSAPAPA